ncbi:hypothetical protein [Acetobacter tropicalis]|uniref:Uncharacterized protein n=2 Tax=Acetobacter tropicalis TaxID=104102 RepID=A0A511FR02_9PROT|nr:hypothetical protein [Acetobacter tropicalis]GEL51310.1 hypothetical protein ATR01nite_23850 [Acetobacter tropicalis]
MTSEFMKTPSFLSTPVAEKSQDEAFEEASLRNALERLGSSSRPRPQQTARPSAEAAQGKRRRFVKDGDVQVEKHSLARTKPRTLAMPGKMSTSRALHFTDEENGEVSKLRRQLAEEKLRAEEAEQQVEALQNAQKSMETRQVHADLMVRELKEKLQQREAELAEHARELRSVQREIAALEEEKEELRKKAEARPRGRPRTRPVEEYAMADEVREEELDVEEPQPVKWWKD